METGMKTLTIGVLMLLIGLLLGSLLASNKYQKEAIEHGVAQYNSTTRSFEWKGEMK